MFLQTVMEILLKTTKTRIGQSRRRASGAARQAWAARPGKRDQERRAKRRRRNYFSRPSAARARFERERVGDCPEARLERRGPQSLHCP